MKAKHFETRFSNQINVLDLFIYLYNIMLILGDLNQWLE
jgi:hypothetical protein